MKLPFNPIVKRRDLAKKKRLSRKRRSALKKTAALVLILLLLATPAVFVNTVIGYLPSLFFLFLLLCCFFYCRLCSRFIVFDEMLDTGSCVRGSEAQMIARIGNRSLLFIPRIELVFSILNLFDEEESLETANIAIGPKRTEDFHFDLYFAHIGEFRIGLRRLVVHDPLSLFSVTLPVDSTNTVLVTPQMKNFDDISLDDTVLEQSLETLSTNVADGIDYNSVRDYIPGDPMKSIHWKLSSRSESYFTKVYERPSNPSLDIFMDFSASADYDSEDLMSIYDVMVETALSLNALAHESGLETRILFMKDEEPQQCSLNFGMDLRMLMRRLPRIRNEVDTSFEEMLMNQGGSIYAASNIVVCSASFSSGMVESLGYIKSTRRNVFVFAFVPEDIRDARRLDILRPLKALDSVKVPYQVLDCERDKSK